VQIESVPSLSSSSIEVIANTLHPTIIHNESIRFSIAS
jgi:hypothetical protein